MQPRNHLMVIPYLFPKNYLDRLNKYELSNWIP